MKSFLFSFYLFHPEEKCQLHKTENIVDADICILPSGDLLDCCSSPNKAVVGFSQLAFCAFFFLSNYFKMTEGIQSFVDSALAPVEFIFFPLLHYLTKQCRRGTVVSYWPHWSLKLTWGKTMCPCICRRSLEPTKAGPWTAWCCAMRWPGGWRMTSPNPLQRGFTFMACTWREPAGTAAAADSLNPNPKFYLRWCLWSGCTLRTMVRFRI